MRNILVFSILFISVVGTCLILWEKASYFQQTQASDGFRLDGMIGLGVLGKQRFVFDFENHTIHFPRTAG